MTRLIGEIVTFLITGILFFGCATPKKSVKFDCNNPQALCYASVKYDTLVVGKGYVIDLKSGIKVTAKGSDAFIRLGEREYRLDTTGQVIDSMMFHPILLSNTQQDDKGEVGVFRRTDTMVVYIKTRQYFKLKKGDYCIMPDLQYIQMTYYIHFFKGKICLIQNSVAYSAIGKPHFNLGSFHSCNVVGL